MRAALTFALVTLLATPAAGQDERTRIDDFAVEAQGSEASGTLEQIGETASPLQDEPQVRDRGIFVAQDSASAPGPVSQISRTGGAPLPQQVAPAGEASAAIADVGSRAQSRPAAVQRLVGADRCDPGLERARLEECLRILERRAGEFTAPEAPVLSAEERLLAEQSNDEPATIAQQGDLRLRYASQVQPDADLRSNQELAALVFDGPPQGTPTSSPAQPEAESLAEVLQGLSIELQGAPQSSGN